MARENIPEFIRLRGCINCGASKLLKEKTGHDYGIDHEIMAKCILSDCVNYGARLSRPFIDPREIYRFLNQYEKINGPSPKVREKVYRTIQNIKDRFGEYYTQMGIYLDLYLRLIQTRK